MAQPSSVKIADVNGDGKPDLIAVCVESCAGTVLFGNGDGTFQPAVSYPGLDAAASEFPDGFPKLAIADLNNDGKLDLVAINHNAAQVSLNNRQGPPYVSTTTTVVSSSNPAPPKTAIVYTATVTSQTGGTLSGTITFRDEGKTAAVLPVTGNKASDRLLPCQWFTWDYRFIFRGRG